jgi:hypothetical protein
MPGQGSALPLDAPARPLLETPDGATFEFFGSEAMGIKACQLLPFVVKPKFIPQHPFHPTEINAKIVLLAAVVQHKMIFLPQAPGQCVELILGDFVGMKDQHANLSREHNQIESGTVRADDYFGLVKQFHLLTEGHVLQLDGLEPISIEQIANRRVIQDAPAPGPAAGDIDSRGLAMVVRKAES